jgi:hypothetical protein
MALADKTIGAPEQAIFHPDKFWQAQALPNATSMTSPVFRMGRTQGGVQLGLFANTTVALAASANMRVELLHDTSATGDFIDSVVLYSNEDATDAVTFEIGAVIAKYIAPDNVESYNKLKITTSADESADKIDTKLTLVAH